MKKIVLILIIVTLQAIKVSAQDTLIVSKEELLGKLTLNNHAVQIAAMKAEMANADYQQSASLYLPRVSASYTGITTNNPLMAFGSKLNQEILTQADFNPTLLNNPDNVQNYATEILVLQPILNLDGVYGRTAAKIQKEAYELQSERTKEYVELELIKAYMQLQLAYEGVEVLKRAAATSEEALEMVSDYYDEGMLQMTDVLDVKVYASDINNQLQIARSNVQNLSDQLAVLVGEEPGKWIFQPSDVAPNSFVESSFPIVIPSNRKDLLAMEKSVEGYESMLQSSKMKFMPRVNAFGSLQIYDDQMLGFGASGYVVGAKLSWDLFNGYSNVAKTHKAKIETDKARIEQSQYEFQQQAELNRATRQLQDAKNKITLGKLALEQSAEAYQMRKDRFEQGLEKTTDLLASETQMFKKELEFKQAVFEYNFTQVYISFLTKG